MYNVGDKIIVVDVKGHKNENNVLLIGSIGRITEVCFNSPIFHTSSEGYEICFNKKFYHFPIKDCMYEYMSLQEYRKQKLKKILL